MDLELKNKRVLITGASKGIGKAIATHFLKEKAKVCLVARGKIALENTVAKLKQNYPADNILSYNCDCTDAEALKVLAETVSQQWRGLDVLIANVGDGQSVSDAIPEEQQWRKTWDTNFNSARLTSYQFLPELQKSSGNLLFISSIAGCEAIGAPTDYATAKAAINAFAINLSRKVAPEVRVNVVAPGNVIFPGGSWQQKADIDQEKVASLLHHNVPLQRFGTPSEIADCVTFLSSARASFITGSVFTIDGGQTLGGL